MRGIRELEAAADEAHQRADRVNPGGIDPEHRGVGDNEPWAWPESQLGGVGVESLQPPSQVGPYSPSRRDDDKSEVGDQANRSSWEGSDLDAVSCLSAIACTAVGSSDYTLAEAWNGKKWRIEPTPRPGQGSSLQDVSCTSATACTAVGDYVRITGNEETLAEAWNGKKWVFERTPNPSGAKSSILNGVSCRSATACTAGGGSGAGVLAESRNGTTWAIKRTPNPAGAKGTGAVYAISCTSARACIAVGGYSNSTGAQLALAEAWNGKSWAIDRTPNPTGTYGSSLSADSCTSLTSCTAVGNYLDSTRTIVTLAEAWDGTKWVIEPTPNPAGATFGSFLDGVSCTSVSACTAVGYYVASDEDEVTLAEAWNGKKWVIEPTSNPTGGSSLSAVSCTSATECTAVGADIAGTLAEAWNGATWVIEPTPNPTGGSSLSAVSCTSATACTAVGSDTNSVGTILTLTERYS